MVRTVTGRDMLRTAIIALIAIGPSFAPLIAGLAG